MRNYTSCLLKKTYRNRLCKIIYPVIRRLETCIRSMRDSRLTVSHLGVRFSKDTFVAAWGTARGPVEGSRSGTRLVTCSRVSRVPSVTLLCKRPRSPAASTPLGSTPRTPPLKQTFIFSELEFEFNGNLIVKIRTLKCLSKCSRYKVSNPILW